MRISKPQNLKEKELIIFDLDGTLSPSKSEIDAGMAKLFSALSNKKQIAVISGGQLSQFKLQLLFPLKGKGVNLKNLFLFPTNSTAFYRWNRAALIKVYSYELSKSEVQKIKEAFKQAFIEIDYQQPPKTYGEVIQNRGTQITFSALGQNVVATKGKEGIKLKSAWVQKSDVRAKLAKVLQRLLPQFSVRIGGLTSIDITRKGIDKAYGVRQIQKHLKIPIQKMLFVGDAIFPGGNDYEALKTGIDYVAVKGPAETKKLIQKLI